MTGISGMLTTARNTLQMLREKRDNIFPNDNCIAPHGG